MLVAGGCHSESTPPQAERAVGPLGVVRVALADFRWPLDPALAEGRDETTIARTLYATPLRTDPATGAVVPGLCAEWKATGDFREWRFTCRSASSIAAALRRVVRLPHAPAGWLFADATRISAQGSTLLVRLRHAWRRFPYALTSIGAAPRSVTGRFRLVSGSRDRVVVRSSRLTVVFSRLGPRDAVREFRRGEVDEAPVPLGDLAATKADPALKQSVRVRTLLGLDLVVFHRLAAQLRRAYWQTVNRADYEELVPEVEGSAAHGLIGVGAEADKAAFRRAVKAIPSLPRIAVRVGVPPDPVLRFAAALLYAQWRDVGLGPRLVTDPAAPVEASFRRLLAAYPQEEAIPAELVLGESVRGRAGLLRALAATRQHDQLERLDEVLRDSAAVVPVAWVVDARLVSSRLHGWREDVLGNVDYSAVRSPVSSRRP